VNFPPNFGFVYVPRTGGTFLSNWETKIFSNQKKQTSEYSLRMIHLTVSRLLEINGEDTKIFTIVRDPYDQACSEYFYIKNRVDVLCSKLKLDVKNKKHLEVIAKSAKNFTGNPHYENHVRKIFEKDLSLEEFLEQRENDCVYSFYFDIKTPKDFNFVGMTENMDTTLSLAKKIFNIELGKGNKNSGRGNTNEPYKTGYSRKLFQEKNLNDYSLYYEGKERFEELCKQEKIN
jgi:hypothetical protein